MKIPTKLFMQTPNPKSKMEPSCQSFIPKQNRFACFMPLNYFWFVGAVFICQGLGIKFVGVFQQTKNLTHPQNCKKEAKFQVSHKLKKES